MISTARFEKVHPYASEIGDRNAEYVKETGTINREKRIWKASSPQKVLARSWARRPFRIFYHPLLKLSSGERILS